MDPNYQVEYKINGIPNIFEFYLFVNPFGLKCFYCEQEIVRSIELIATNIDVHILPFHNQLILKDFIKQLGLESVDLNTRNNIFQKVYQASLAFKAASMQGKRYGRQYLMAMQQKAQGDIDIFDKEFAIDLAKEIGLDVETFTTDMDSDFVRQLYMKDQKVAHEMDIERTPALVIYELQSNTSDIIMNEAITLDSIFERLDRLVENHYLETQEKNHKHPTFSVISKNGNQ